ncbi:hypothetical protein GGTG_00058 [Gaeumannomyces tritici R3-111a-1]|uniref:Uncharacterized protein n=1 Tax=Gaeumannomyces tritici (strain R3-111a-1) TaxID=644352 RepID=J3NFL2_GAET3|nr:hypothetical protein GGTG_00058 [Gaeumannomyces tritici R3-111a-1]EJT80052.1 hypothetical protein GGTG_00058 [Gaeumannomyces tritici R3-111a-1]
MVDGRAVEGFRSVVVSFGVTPRADLIRHPCPDQGPRRLAPDHQPPVAGLQPLEGSAQQLSRADNPAAQEATGDLGNLVHQSIRQSPSPGAATMPLSPGSSRRSGQACYRG